jgi:hypothetical protein
VTEEEPEEVEDPPPRPNGLVDLRLLAVWGREQRDASGQYACTINSTAICIYGVVT